MAEFLTVAEVYRIEHGLIEMFGGRHGVRDKGAVEAAVFRPQMGCYDSIEEEAAALMESLANNHGFVDGNKRIAFTAADVFLRRHGFFIEVEAGAGYGFITGSVERQRIPLCEDSCLDPAAHQTASFGMKLVLHRPHPVLPVRPHEVSDSRD